MVENSVEECLLNFIDIISSMSDKYQFVQIVALLFQEIKKDGAF